MSAMPRAGHSLPPLPAVPVIAQPSDGDWWSVQYEECSKAAVCTFAQVLSGSSSMSFDTIIACVLVRALLILVSQCFMRPRKS